MGERENLREIAKNYILNAKEKLDSAEILYKERKFADSISRSYYAAFLSAKAILLLIGENPKTHSGLVTIFGLKLIKNNLLDKEYAKILTGLLNAHQECDYNPLTWFDKDDTQEFLKKAKKFVNQMIILVDQIK